ncbi:MAG: hypothetical protein KatS3mg121_0226 [Gammaproteobacteria bacterium]|nr:MAG: hypothetical protein KatS3mg121_0226 [Gammaproteobacteria bacterium]
MLIDTRRLTGLMLSLMLSLLLASPAMAQLAAGHGKFLGNITQGGNVPSNFGQYWNQITPENEGKWGVVESSRDSYNWSGLDRAYDYARSAGIPFKQHTFVWGNQEPGWIGGLSQAEQRAEVEEFMIDYCARYPATDLIDVVNEPLSDPPSYAAALGGDGATGWDWVITAFEMARQHCPNAQLLINEYGIINDPSKRSRYVEIIDLLRQRGLIDGIGIQAHTFNVVDYSVDNLRGNLDALAQTGLPIYVSEWDINLADDQAQLQQYQQKFPVVWEHPGVAGVTLWGYIQGQTWQSDAWLVSSSGQERPALQWLRQYLQGGGSSSSSSTRSSSSSSSSSSSMPPPSSSSSSSSTGGSGACAVDYVIANDWGSGFQVNVTVRNLSSQPIDGWTLVWNLGAGESFAGGWNASFSTSGSRVTASNPAGHWNGSSRGQRRHGELRLPGQQQPAAGERGDGLHPERRGLRRGGLEQLVQQLVLELQQHLEQLFVLEQHQQFVEQFLELQQRVEQQLECLVVGRLGPLLHAGHGGQLG